MSDYGRRTQIVPVVVASAPITVVAVTFFRVHDLGQLVGSLGVLVATAAFQLIAARLVRDRGNAVQKRLWAAWGGNPAVQKLRWSSGPTTKVARLHRRVEAMTGVRLPDQAQEAAECEVAEDTYEDAVERLRELTRDHVRYPRVYEELVRYGAERNLYGLKPMGLVIAFLILVAMTVVTALNLLDVTDTAWWSISVSAAVALASVLMWQFVVTPSWIEPSATRYADALLATAGEPGDSS